MNARKNVMPQYRHDRSFLSKVRTASAAATTVFAAASILWTAAQSFSKEGADDKDEAGAKKGKRK